MHFGLRVYPHRASVLLLEKRLHWIILCKTHKETLVSMHGIGCPPPPFPSINADTKIWCFHTFTLTAQATPLLSMHAQHQYAEPKWGNLCNYHPPQSCDKVMFLHLSVILFTGGVYYIPLLDRPPRQTPSWAETPLSRHPPGRNHPPGQTPPYAVHAGKQSTSGR